MERKSKINTPPAWVDALRPAEPQGPALLSLERGKSSLDAGRFANLIYSDRELEVQRGILDIVQNDNVFDKRGNYFDSRVDRFKASVARGKRLHQLQQLHKWNEDELKYAIELVGEPTSYSIHWKGYLPTISEQGTPEQHELFLRPAERLELVGSYSQTELAHGSNVRGIETTATWNPSDRSFILHSPSLTAAKWWVGTLGRTANCTVVIARLILEGKDYGPHPFFCQVRDLKTHELLEGRYVGDIGPKMGYNTVDNGFLLLNQVKVPHVNMLARFSRVDPKTNAYVPPPSPAVVYGTLTKLRAALVLESARNLARGLTIAIRYCAVRCQFAEDGSSQERQVLDYTMVQHRLFPLLAETFALHLAGQATLALYNEMVASRDQGRDKERAKDVFAELHATSCGLKALATTAAVEGIETSRRACGGHGFSSFAGFGTIYADYLPSQTYEGDNYVLTQQTAKYVRALLAIDPCVLLLKSAQSVINGKKPSNSTTETLAKYLETKKQNQTVSFDLDKDADLVAAFGRRAADLAFPILNHRDHAGKSESSLLVDYWRLSTAHSQFQVLRAFHNQLHARSRSLDTQSREVAWKLFRLFALTQLVKSAHEFYVSGALTPAQVERADKETIMQLLADIRPHAVTLIEAWKIPDWQLDSSLGRADGRVYEDMFERAARQNPLNRLKVDPRPGSRIHVIEAGDRVRPLRSNI